MKIKLWAKANKVAMLLVETKYCERQLSMFDLTSSYQ